MFNKQIVVVVFGFKMKYKTVFFLSKTKTVIKKILTEMRLKIYKICIQFTTALQGI